MTVVIYQPFPDPGMSAQWLLNDELFTVRNRIYHLFRRIVFGKAPAPYGYAKALWGEHLEWLAVYADAVLREADDRVDPERKTNYREAVEDLLVDLPDVSNALAFGESGIPHVRKPPWWGLMEYHDSHKSTLTRLNPVYGGVWPDVPSDLPLYRPG